MPNVLAVTDVTDPKYHGSRTRGYSEVIADVRRDPPGHAEQVRQAYWNAWWYASGALEMLRQYRPDLNVSERADDGFAAWYADLKLDYLTERTISLGSMTYAFDAYLGADTIIAKEEQG